MKNKLIGLLTLLATAIASGYALSRFLKKAGIQDSFDFDLNDDLEEELDV